MIMRLQLPLALCITLFVIEPVFSQEQGKPPETLVVTLRPASVIPNGPVLLGYIATLSGADLPMRQKMASLDLLDAPNATDAIPIPRELVAYRLQIAGLKKEQFRVEGPPYAVVTRNGIKTTGQGPDVLIKPRDIVTLVARIGPVRLTTRGEAQQDGRMGERIRVRNIDSRKDVFGRVVDRGLVEVEY